jgi:hypothetical protein
MNKNSRVRLYAANLLVLNTAAMAIPNIPPMEKAKIKYNRDNFSR